MTNIYMVSSGEYSEFEVRGLFSTPELAKTFSDAHGFYFHEDPWVLDEMEPNVREGMKAYRVGMDKEGNSTWSLFEGDPDKTGGYQFCVKTISFSPLIRVLDLSVFCWATDEHHAAKIANEKRIKLIADGEWEKEKRRLQSVLKIGENG